MRKLAWVVAAIGGLAAVVATSTEIVVLRGGARIELQGPPVQQGNNVLLTRTDGTLLSAPVSEIDWKATAAARSAPKAAPAPAFPSRPSTPAEAARASSEGGKARIKITDADVGHVQEPAADAARNEKEGTGRTTPAKLEIADHTQERSGANLVVRGTLRNVGATSALRTRMTVTAVDEAGKAISSGEATMSGGTIESGHGVAFTASLPVGDQIAASVRFAPQWVPEPPPAALAPPAAARPAAAMPESPAASPAGSKPPAPVPTPYGLGSLYSAPAPSASMSPPSDGKTGYIPGAARPEDQPKPPQ